MAVPTTRVASRHDASGRNPTDDARVSAGRTPTALLGQSGIRNRKHPPSVEHVNRCSDCTVWLMDYMFNVAQSLERKIR